MEHEIAIAIEHAGRAIAEAICSGSFVLCCAIIANGCLR